VLTAISSGRRSTCSSTTGGVIEVRAPITRGRTLAGYFNDRDRFVTEVAKLSGRAPGVYATANPVEPALLARACNRIEDYAKHLTTDGDIARRRYVPLDLDATRPAGISATDDEHALALAVTDRTIAFLGDHGVPRESLIVADSGNGGHVHVPVDLPNDDTTTQLARAVLAAVGAHVDTDRVHVDQTMFNAARIIKIVGTVARKGDSIPTRPHRLATFRHVPPRWTPVERAVLEAIAALHCAAPRPRQERAPARHPGGAFNVRTFLADHGVSITREKSWTGTTSTDPGTFLQLDECLFDASHNRGEAGVIVLANGMLLYSCRHNSCRTKRWEDVRRLLEPRRASRTLRIEVG
jgi:hypothetical protein